jgi:hypothetical protein
MRNLFYVLGFACLLLTSSCAGTRYKYYSFESSQPFHEEKDGFIRQTADLLEVKYSWKTANHIELDVRNNSEKGVWIDWQNSHSIVNGVTQSNPYEKASFALPADSSQTRDTTNRQEESMRSAWQGDTLSDAFISPRSEKHFSLPMSGLTEMDGISSYYTQVQYSNEYYKPNRDVRVRQYRQSTSPFVVRVQLAYQPMQGEKAMIQQEFWLKEVVETECDDLHMVISGRQEPPLDERRHNKVSYARSVSHSPENTLAVIALIGGLFKILAWASEL